MSFFYKLKNAIKNIISKPNFDLTELEDILIEADFGYKLAAKIAKNLLKSKNIHQDLCTILESILSPCIKSLEIDKSSAKPYTILFVGVNGSGKTTTIAKIAHMLQKQSFSVDIAACDTFRAAATEQLSIWAEKLNCHIFKADTPKDPASVAFDAMQNSKSDILLIDTAGRMHNNTNLMNELCKIHTVLKKFNQHSPQQTIITIDATIGQNSMEQIQAFHKICHVSGIILTKMDGGAKGGTIVNIIDTMKIPILGIGIGENASNLAPFSITKFLHDLVG